ncbi:MAG: RNA 2',3'-cyclic phosphodiesterase [bacterium]
MSIRIFVAVPVPLEVTRPLAEFAGEVGPGAGRIKWVDPGSMHLTLFFLGDVEEERVPAIGEALGRAAGEVAPFTVRLDRVGAFPNLERPRVLWVGVSEGSGNLQDLKEAVDRVLEPLGFEPDRRTFHPHLTLGRIKAPGRRGAVAEAAAGWDVPSASWTVDRVVLYQSTLTREGAVYEELEAPRLG